MRYKCSLGKRCVVKTDDNYVFRKFTLLCAISNSKCVGAIFLQRRWYDKRIKTQYRRIKKND